MEKTIKNKSIILGLMLLFVFGLVLLAPKVGLAAGCDDVICVGGQICVEDPVARCIDDPNAPAYTPPGETPATTSISDCPGFACGAGEMCCNKNDKGEAIFNCTTQATCSSRGGISADAQNQKDAVSGSGSWGPLDNFVGKVLAYVFNKFLSILSFFLYIVTGIFSKSIEYSLQGSYLNLPIIKSAWTICRDLANVFFVFILLYISLATILQLSGKSLREMLVKTIITAILLNFSYTITGIIIDASNVIAIEFYNKANSQNGVSNIGISDKIMNGLDMTTLWKSSTSTPDVSGNKILSVIIASVFGSILIVVLICVFLIAAFMFVARSVTFMFLLMLSPLAFAADALPRDVGGISKYASQWWGKLLSNAVFAPVYMFILYLTIEIVNSKKILDINGASFGDIVTSGASGSPVSDSAILLILNYMLVIGLLMGSIIVAKSSGVEGATYAVGKFDKYRKSATSTAQNLAKRTGQRAGGAILGSPTLGLGTPIGQRISTRTAKIAGLGTAPGSSKAAVAGGKVLRGLGVGMAARGIGGGIATVQRTNKEKVDQLAKNYEGMSVQQLANILKTNPMAFNQAAILQTLAKKGKLNDKAVTAAMSPKQFTDTLQVMQRQGLNIKDIAKLRPDLYLELQKVDPTITRASLLNSLKVTDIANLDENLVASDPTFMKEFIKGGASPAHINAIASRGDGLTDALTKELETYDASGGKSAQIIAANLVATNPKLAQWIKTNTQALPLLGLNP